MRKVLLTLILFSSAVSAAPTINAPSTASMGTQLEVTVAGMATGAENYLTVVEKGSQQGAYNATESVPGPGKYLVKVGVTPGEFEIWLCEGQSRKVLARRPIKVLPVSATVSGPTQAAAGSEIEVKWSGPDYGRDYIAVGTADPQVNVALTYQYTETGNPVRLQVPADGGDYVIRYLTGDGNVPLASQPIKVGGVSASLTAPATVASGAKINIQWSGPNNPRDFITIVKAGAPEQTWQHTVETARGNPVTFNAPDSPGKYEARYLSGLGEGTLARAAITVSPVAGSVTAPAQVVAGDAFKVGWKGPDTDRNFITLVRKGAPEGTSTATYAYTGRANPLDLIAPLEPGDYELRYLTSDSSYLLARASVKVVPGKQEPGKIAVTLAPGTKSGGAVELILDASGSMLQKLGAARRIDIAKQTLTKLTSSTIPPGTPFALRVFGREVDSCQTDLDVPLSPLNAKAVAQRIDALVAKNGAKTPIGASLAKVGEDLKAAGGEKLVVLITDGEETCGGDPAAEIAKLRKAGIGTRVSIVGFALDDQKLAATFRRWSDLGGGAFFDAKDGAGLDKSLTAALRSGFELVNTQGQVVASGVVGGDPIPVPPGNYTARIKDRANTAKSVSVKSKETASVAL